MKIVIYLETGDCPWACKGYGVGEAGELDIYQEDAEGHEFVADTFAPGTWSRVRVVEE